MKKKITIKDRGRVNPNWEDDVDRLILYADFMGFTARVMSQSHEEMKKQLMDFKEKWTKKMEPLSFGEHLKFAQFSDSILIVANGTNEQKFNLLTKAAISLVHTAMSLRLPIKGVIAQGKFSYDEKNELYFGKPLVSAYDLHNQIKYYGIVVHHSAENTIKTYKDQSNPYSDNPIYIERGKVRHYHLCWNLLTPELQSGDITDLCKNWIEVIAGEVSGEPRLYIDRTIEVLEKDKNTEMHNDDFSDES